MMLNFLLNKMDLPKQSASGILSRLQYSLRKTIYIEYHFKSLVPAFVQSAVRNFRLRKSYIFWSICAVMWWWWWVFYDGSKSHNTILRRSWPWFKKLLPWNFLPCQNDPCLLPHHWSLMVENPLSLTVYVRS